MEDVRKTMSGKPVFTVPSRTVVNFNSFFGKKLLCDNITFTAGQACNFSCSFCYVDSMQRKSQEWFNRQGVVYPQEGHSGVVIRIKDSVEIARNQILSKPEPFRMAKKVIYASPKVDVAGNLELVRETVEILKVILELTNWDIRLLSKSNLLPQIAKYFGSDRWPIGRRAKDRIIYGVSTGTLEDNLAAAFEQGTPKVSKRIESLHWLQDNGFRTFGMICPSLPQWLPGNSEQQAYRHFAADMFKAIRAEKCEHVWAEVINLRGKSFTRTVANLRDAGYGAMADELARVSVDKAEWERYARATFEAHAEQPYRPGQLRFLQYVTKSTEAWWRERESKGALVL